MRSLLSVGVLIASLWMMPAVAATVPVTLYAQPPEMASVEMSPDGSHVAYLAPLGGRQHVVINKTLPEPGTRPAAFAPPDEAEIIAIDWANDERLILTIMATERLATTAGMMPIRFMRMVAINRDGSNVKVLLNRGANAGNYYVQHTPILQYIDNENVLALFPTSGRPDPDIVKLNIYTGRFNRVSRGLRNASGYLPDPTGEVRIAYTYNDRSGVASFLMRDAGGMYKPMRRSNIIREGLFSVLGFTADGQKLYVSTPDEQGRDSIYLYDMEKDEIGEKVLGDDRYDVDDAVLERGAVVAFDWVDDLPRRHWIDPARQQLQDLLDKALPDSREIIVDASKDDRLILIASYATNQPTTYRLFNRETKQFSLFGDTYPNLPQDLVATHQPVQFKARDGLDIPAYLTLPVGSDGRNLPFIIMPHGGPYVRDTGSFDRLAQFLASRGYGVIQPNFRGSSGYGTAFQAAGFRQWGGVMQDDVTDAAHWVISQGYADPQRMCILGWSYGGYAALMGAIKTPDLFKCAVATAPVANMERLYDELAWIRAKNYNRDRIFGEGPAQLLVNSPVHLADRIKVPVLLIHGDRDAQAFVQHSRDMDSALRKAGKQVEYVEIKGMDHSPLNTADMQTVLENWERFLAAHIGAGTTGHQGN
ncbi:alpha/beta hydrolase family protein [Niveispirillum irakense]|uniref:alpha/beta hydrolase family protein n=1 Tax=Niveispirillum irakense TaxID=34011 RepID=UPI00041FAD01|nr:S9 family peptidase [Niveispirillum irakense]